MQTARITSTFRQIRERFNSAHALIKTLFLILTLVAFFLILGAVPNPAYRLLAVTGGSMEPALFPGDLLVVTPLKNKLTKGEIITLTVNDQMVTHRFLGYTADGQILTQGDANTIPDYWNPNANVGVVGIYRYRIPLAGYLYNLPRKIGQAVDTGSWFMDEEHIEFGLTTGKWPSDNDTTTIFTYKTARAHWKLEEGRFIFPLEVVVSGEVCVINTGSNPTRDLTIYDQIMYFSNGRFWPLHGASFTLIPEEQISSGKKVCYPYQIEFLRPRGVLLFHNTVRATISNFGTSPMLKNADSQSLSLQESQAGQDEFEAVAEFTLEEPPSTAEPNPTQTESPEPTLNPLPTETLTAIKPTLPSIEEPSATIPPGDTPATTATPVPTETPQEVLEQRTDTPPPIESPLPSDTPEPTSDPAPESDPPLD